MQFVYQARDATGKVKSGEVAAATQAEATKQLRQEGLYLLSIDEQSSAKAPSTGVTIRKRIKRSEIMYITHQLAVLTDSGVPLADTLASLSEQASNPALADVLQRIHGHVEGGEDLSVALARYPRYFDNTYVNLIKASEASGTLAHMLDRIAVQMRAELETRQRVTGALLYPASMMVMCVGVCVFLLIYVFPKLTPMFATKQMAVPTPTKVLMTLSDTLINYWYLWLLGLAVVVGGSIYARAQPWGRRALDWFLLSCPILGPMMRKVALGRSMRTLATTINAGVPVLEALELSGAVSGNSLYEQFWLEVCEQVTTGKQIHETLDDTTMIPPTVRQMIASGEATGKLGGILNKVSDYYETEIKNAIKSATSLIEPLMVFAMGGVIGTLALAMLLPIFKLSGSGH